MKMFIIPAYCQEVSHLGSVVLLVCRRIVWHINTLPSVAFHLESEHGLVG